MHRHKTQQKTEQGFSLIVALLALMLLSAVAVGMMFIASTETSVASNFKSEETAYFAARAGVEEVRDRMLPSPPSPGGAFSINGSLPAFMPGAGNPWALYILNGTNPQTGANMAIGDVTNPANLAAGSIVADDELCHDFPSYMGYTAANIRCTTLPSTAGWNTSTTSIAPLPVDYKWVRVTLKANNSYGGTNANLFVDSTKPAGNQVCLFGSLAGAHEVVVPVVGQACSTLNATPVYLVTALAVSPSGGSKGAKRMVQQEIGQFFGSSNLPGGLFAVGTGCGALSIQGGAQTGSYDSATNTPPTLTGGDVGSNGNVYVNGGNGSTAVNGSINTPEQGTVGSCPGNGVSKSGNPSMGTINGGTALFTPPVPPMPNPLPPQTKYPKPPATMPATLAPGSYGNVTMTGGTVTLGATGTVSNPAVYTMNSLSMTGGASLVIAGPVILNFAGVNLNGNPPVVLSMGGQTTFSNTTQVASEFVINYGGTDSISVNGGTTAYAEINAPNSPITLGGGSTFYGQIIGNTINETGGTIFYWDKALVPPPPVNTTTFARIAMRELSY